MPFVLFVCTANIIRSPFAEGYFRKLIQNNFQAWQVSSAGTWARRGDSAHPLVLKKLEEFGINIQDHRSREVSGRILADVDIIFVMEEKHREALRIEFPRSAWKVHLLSELKGQEQDIVDPIGGKEIDYQATFSEIGLYLENSLDKIRDMINKT